MTTTPVGFRSSAPSHVSAPEHSDSPPPPPQVALNAADRAVIAGAERALLDERRLLTGDELAALAALPDGAVMNLAGESSRIFVRHASAVPHATAAQTSLSLKHRV